MDRSSIQGGVQTRRGGKKDISQSVPPTNRGGRTASFGSRGGSVARKPERKTKREDSIEHASDIYEFRDESDESKNHPRLIMTIKSSLGGNLTNSTPTVVVKEQPPVITTPVKVNKNPDFVSPSSNTRKSARLQERDGSRTTVDDTIDEVVKNKLVKAGLLPANDVDGIVTRAQANVPNTRRSTRQVKPATPETGKKGRPGRKGKDRRASETTDDSSEEKGSAIPTLIIKKSLNEIDVKVEPKVQQVVPPPRPVVLSPKLEEEKKVENPNPLAMGRKAAMLRRLKDEQANCLEEPQTLIDPVTGHLLIMKESSEGQYITLSTIASTAVTTTGPVTTTRYVFCNHCTK